MPPELPRLRKEIYAIPRDLLVWFLLCINVTSPCDSGILFDMELTIQGRVHSGKLRITVQTQVKLKWED